MADMAELQQEAFVTACGHGWWVDPATSLWNGQLPKNADERLALKKRLVHTSGGPAGQLALIHSEVSEMLEAFRVNDMGNAQEEGADIVIRLMDLFEAHDWSLHNAVVAKMARNRNRPYKHGGKLF